MPKKAGYISVPEQRLAPAAIGKALRDRWKHIDRDSILQSRIRVSECWQSMNLPVITAERQGTLSQAEKRNAVFDFQRELWSAPAALELLCMVVFHEDQREQLRTIAITNEVPRPDEFTGPNLSHGELGQRVQQAVHDCRERVDQLKTSRDGHRLIVSRLVEECLKRILAELRRLRILDVCRHCGEALYPAVPTKQYCSPDYEGKNCGVNARMRRRRQRTP